MNQKDKKVIFILDMDAYFASCHIAVDPSLKDKNVVVSSPNRKAIITTASYKARRFKISAGMPIFKAKELCDDLVIVNSDFALYIKFSHLIFDTITNLYTNKIEVASVDECYIDVTNVWKKYGSVKKLAENILKEIYVRTGLTGSIGISTNKFLAKMCVDFNKPNGITMLLPQDIKTVLWPMEIRKMYMVGSTTEKILKLNNINTIGDLANTDLDLVQDLLGKRGFTLWNWANGVGSDEVEFEKNELKSIGNELTLNFPTLNPKEIEDIIYELCLKVSERAIKRFLKGRTISIVVRYEKEDKSIFNKELHRKTTTKQISITKPTNKENVIFSLAKKCFYELWNGKEISLIGVRLGNVIEDISHVSQLSLADVERNKNLKHSEVDSIVNALKNKFGDKKVFTGNNLLKYNKKNRDQSKYLKNDDVHISNNSIIKKWNKKEGS